MVVLRERGYIVLAFRHALKIRLGVAFEDRPGLCKCKTRSPIDPHVDHLFNCHLFTAGFKDRHDAMAYVNTQENLSPFPNMVINALPLKMMERPRMV